MDLIIENEGEIIGYTDPWVASPGQQVSVKVSPNLKDRMIVFSYYLLI